MAHDTIGGKQSQDSQTLIALHFLCRALVCTGSYTFHRRCPMRYLCYGFRVPRRYFHLSAPIARRYLPFHLAGSSIYQWRRA